MSDKAPKAPKISASKAEHKKHAKEVLDYEPYKREPEGGVTEDEIPEKEWKKSED